MGHRIEKMDKEIVIESNSHSKSLTIHKENFCISC